MVRKLIEWAVNNPLIVLAMTLGLVAVGAYSYRHINVEAYPDPAPAIVELVAQWPGASAEEVERLVTVPLAILEQAAIADEVTAILMGDDVELRKHFIQTNAKDVRFLDI